MAEDKVSVVVEGKEIMHAMNFIQELKAELKRYQDPREELFSALCLVTDAQNDFDKASDALRKQLQENLDQEVEIQKYNKVFGTEYKETKTLVEARARLHGLISNSESSKMQFRTSKEKLYTLLVENYQKEDSLNIFKDNDTYTVMQGFFDGEYNSEAGAEDNTLEEFTNVGYPVVECFDRKIRSLKAELSFAEKAVRQLQWKERCLKYCADNSLTVDPDRLNEVISTAMRHHNETLLASIYPGKAKYMHLEHPDYSDPDIINLDSTKLVTKKFV